ncbi:MAG TPA: Ig-like domain-containing protein [Acidimicrobiales bacterium]|jgi:hypothetical protein
MRHDKRPWGATIRRLALVGAGALMTTTLIAEASASATRLSTRTPPSAQGLKTGSPAKVTPGSSWTLERTGTGCEIDVFGSRHRFSSAISDGSGDGGTYKGKKRLTMTWKSGLASGGSFTGRWQGVTGDYTGRYSLDGQSASATLIPYVTGACLSSSSMTARPTYSSIVLGSGETDTATVYGTGNVTPTGTVTLYLCPGNTVPCTPSAAAEAGDSPTSMALTGTGNVAGARSPVDTPTALGAYCYLAVYSGDSHYAIASDGATTDQCFTVTNGDDVATAPSTTSFSLGGSVFDTATVTGDTATAPTGTVTFYVCGPATTTIPCTEADRKALGPPVAVSATTDANVVTAASIPYTPTGVGDYCFVGVYSGDNNYASGTDGSTAECFIVTAAAGD